MAVRRLTNGLRLAPLLESGRMGTPGTAEHRVRSGLYLAITAAALLVTLYLILQLIGVLFKLLFLAAVVVIGLMAWRAWRTSS
jgi:hypothetical protein